MIEDVLKGSSLKSFVREEKKKWKQVKLKLKQKKHELKNLM